MIRFLIIGLKCLVQNLWLTICYVFESVFWTVSGYRFSFADTLDTWKENKAKRFREKKRQTNEQTSYDDSHYRFPYWDNLKEEEKQQILMNGVTPGLIQAQQRLLTNSESFCPLSNKSTSRRKNDSR